MKNLKEGGILSFMLAVLSLVMGANVEGIGQLAFCIVSQIWCAAGVVLHSISKSKDPKGE